MSKLLFPKIDPPTEDEYATFHQVISHIDQGRDALKRLARIRNDRRYEMIAELLGTTKDHIYKIVGETAGGRRER